MDVFDSNIWIFGLTQACEEAVSLVDRAIDTAYHVGVSAYIFEEVMHNLQRSSHDQEIIERVQTRFADIVYGNPTIHGPTQAEIQEIDLDMVRRDPRIQAMGEAFDIQNKDVPIIVFARQCAHPQDAPEVVIHTADREFSRFNPQQHFESIDMRYVDCST
jgi:hypothetical protein